MLLSRTVHKSAFVLLLSGTGPAIRSGGVVSQGLSAASPTSSEAILFAAVGDVMIGSTFPDASRLPPQDGAELLKPFTSILSAADVTFGNLEGPLLDGAYSSKCGPSSAAGSCYAFRMPRRYGQYLKDAGFTGMSVANNHAGDFGEAGRASTRQVLDELGIHHAGSDRGKFSTCVLQVKGKRIGFVGFAHNDVVPNVNDLSAAREIVLRLKATVDLVVVSFHGGAEGATHQHVGFGTEVFFHEPRGDLRAFTHAVVEAGADLVLGHGPHVMRGMEIYRGRLIAYSMGNFCTYGWFTLAGPTALTAVFTMQLAPDGSFLRGRLFSGRQVEPGGPTPDPSEAAVQVVRRLSEQDFGSDAPAIEDDGSFSPRHLVFEPANRGGRGR